MIDPLGHESLLATDSRGLVTRVTDPLLTETNATGRVVAHLYDGAGREIAKVYPDGTTDERVFDDEGRVVAGSWRG